MASRYERKNIHLRKIWLDFPVSKKISTEVFISQQAVGIRVALSLWQTWMNWRALITCQ